MSKQIEQERLITHINIQEDFDSTLFKMRERIKQHGDKPQFPVSQQLDFLNQLAQFDFGRYLLQNQGINGFWTHYMLMHPWHGRKTGTNNRGEKLTNFESFMLDSAPTILATQQRFEIFLKENQKCVEEGMKLACIPCGMMGELLYLDYDRIKNIDLVGIDYDANTLSDAQNLAEKLQLMYYVELMQRDAWNLQLENEFDLISSNGLNFYEPDDNKVTELYRQFYLALKPDGKLVTSFLTPPPGSSATCEWDMTKINRNDLLLQKMIFIDLLEAKFQCYRSSAQTQQQLESVGFTNIQFIYDDAKIFPTVIAYK